MVAAVEIDELKTPIHTKTWEVLNTLLVDGYAVNNDWQQATSNDPNDRGQDNDKLRYKEGWV